MGSQVDWNKLAQHAWAMRENAYAPYSRFSVGAALLAESGEIFTGCNVENKSFGLSVCAERAALFSAVTTGFRNFAALAVVAKTTEVLAPRAGLVDRFWPSFMPRSRYTARRDGAHKIWTISNSCRTL